jgi:hypothetical protein
MEEEREKEEREFALLSNYGQLGGQLREKQPIKRLDNVNEYLAFRAEYFGLGPADLYREFATKSDAEFEEHADVMTKAIHAPAPGRRLNPNQKTEAQKLLYRWVRAAYKRKEGNDFHVANHIKENYRLWTELKAELEQTIWKPYGKSLEPGGFNVRPEIVGRLVLGTISKHSEGEALDIEWEANPQILRATWTFIEKFVGKTVVRDESRWWQSPQSAEGLWRDVEQLSAEFVRKVASEVERWKEIIKWAYVIEFELRLQEEESKRRQKKQGVPSTAPGPQPSIARGSEPNPPPTPVSTPTPVAVSTPITEPPIPTGPEPPKFLFDRLMFLPPRPRAAPAPNDRAWQAWELYPTLQKRYPNGIPQPISDSEAYRIIFEKLPEGMDNKLIIKEYVKKGFFTLKWKLGQLLHANGYKWGVTFDDPDLMHFVKPKEK